jgi:DNA repair protein RadC
MKYEQKLKNLNLVRDYKNKKVVSAQSIYEMADDYKRFDKEVFAVYLLDTKNKVKKREIISIGIMDASIIHPREVFRLAILTGSSKIILSHNHPSGDTNPSDEDINITEQLKRAGELIGIEVLDHVIVGKRGYWSYVE